MLKAPSMAANELLTRTAGGTTTQCRWEGGRHVLTEEDAFGDLTRTYIGRSAAHVDGTNPATGTWRFYVHDHLGSTRGVYNSDKTQYAAFEHDPYGEVYASSGSVSDITRRYTGHDWDDAAQFYYAPYRYYAPGLARWLTRDPAGMKDGLNMYSYVGRNPIIKTDPYGDTGSWYSVACGCICGGASLAAACCEAIPWLWPALIGAFGCPIICWATENSPPPKESACDTAPKEAPAHGPGKCTCINKWGWPIVFDCGKEPEYTPAPHSF